VGRVDIDCGEGKGEERSDEERLVYLSVRREETS